MKMHKIGIIDDNKDQRETLRILLESHLEEVNSSLNVIDIFPLKEQKQYPQWINSNDIVCLIFDEQMHNESEDDQSPVGYRGNQLVTAIREKFKDIPIYVITSHKNDDDLKAKFSEFEDIIDRDEFTTNGNKYTKRFVRAAQRYLQENYKELNEIESLAQKVAMNKANKEDLERLKALQLKLNLTVDNYNDRHEWLNEYEERINSLSKLKEELQSKFK